MNRICMIVLSLYPQDVRVRREAEALARQGIAVDIICLRDTKQAKVEQMGNVTAYRIIKRRSKEKILHYLLLSLQFTAGALLQLQKLSLRRRYDLIQVHNMPDYLVLAGLPHRLIGRPMVLDLHDLSVELFQSKWSGAKSAILLPMVRLTERICCGLCNELITTSQGFRRKLMDRGIPDKKITLVLNTADPNIFHLHESREFVPINEGARLLYHGTVAERFGLLKAVEAVAKVQETIPGTTLDIYGKYDPSCREMLDRRVVDLGIEDQVVFHGMRSLEEINEIIKDSDIGVVPYLSDEFMNLALSTKTFEYAATGLPVVASRTEALTSLFNDECIQYFQPGDETDMAEKIVQLCQDPQRRKQQSTRSQDVLGEISYSVMIDRYLNLMQGLIQNNKP